MFDIGGRGVVVSGAGFAEIGIGVTGALAKIVSGSGALIDRTYLFLSIELREEIIGLVLPGVELEQVLPVEVDDGLMGGSRTILLELVTGNLFLIGCLCVGEVDELVSFGHHANHRRLRVNLGCFAVSVGGFKLVVLRLVY